MNQSTRIRIACTTGLLAIFLASGPAWATYGNDKDGDRDGMSWSHDRDGKKCRDKKSLCRKDQDCKEGFFCHNDHKCRKQWSDFCRTDADCKHDFVCDENYKCHKKDCEPQCRCDADCQADQTCGTDGVCHDVPCDDDGDACTTEAVIDRVCTHTPIANCGPECTTDADCADGDDSTTEVCLPDGTCKITPIATTTTTTLPPTAQAEEICGDCIDNNGDGLTDFEDPSCCAQSSYTMNLFSARLVTKESSSRLKLSSRLMPPVLGGVGFLGHDVYVQIRPVKGQDVLCARIPGHSIRMRKHMLKFSGNKIASTKGIDKLLVQLRYHRGPRVTISGKKVGMVGMSQGPMQITLGFYHPELGASEARCSMSMATFRTSGKKGFVTP